MIARGFERILAELRVNSAARAADERRLSQRVADPLQRLATQAMPEAAEEISRLRREASPKELAQMPVRQEELLRRMNDVLNNMLESEGFREAVAMLQAMISAQTELHEQTLAALEQELESILDLDLDEPPPEAGP